MDAVATVLAIGLAGYVAVGLAVGLAFVTAGVTAVQGAPVTVGARVLLLPAAAALWPLVLVRWFMLRHKR